MLSFEVNIMHGKFCSIPWYRTQDRAITKILGKTEQQCLLLNYMHSNCIISISNNIYYVNKFLFNFIPWKPRSAYPKNSGKNVISTPPIERFSSKVDRHHFMLGYYYTLSFIQFCGLALELTFARKFQLHTHAHFPNALPSKS